MFQIYLTLLLMLYKLLNSTAVVTALLVHIVRLALLRLFIT